MKSRICSLRENKDLTQREMAQLLGISKSYYNYFETEERIIPLYYLNKICNLFEVSYDYFFKLTDNNSIIKNNFILDSKVISERIKEIRLNNNLTQDELAKLVHVSQATISSYEKNKTMILTSFMYELGQRFDISLDYIAGRSNIIKTFTK